VSGNTTGKDKVYVGKSKNGINGRPQSHEDKLPPLPSQSMPAGQFVKTAFENLLKSGYAFTDKQLQQYGSIDVTTQYTKQNKPLFWILKDEQTRNSLPKNVRNKYWAKVYMTNGQSFLLFSQWFSDKYPSAARKQNFVDWYMTLGTD